MKATKTLIFMLLAGFFFMMACNDYVKYEETPFYTEEEFETLSEHLDLPESLDQYDVFSTGFGPKNNNMLATLGRVLFYDKDLSVDGTISCASCHQQELAFADNASLSTGVHNNLTDRNSIALGSLTSFDAEYGGNGGTVPGLFWDERAPNVKVQMEETFANPDEMGMDLKQLAGIIKEKPHYQTLFKIAHFEGGSLNDKINTDNILTAIETFVRSLSTSGSKFDVVAEKNNAFVAEDFKQNWNGFTEAENKGKLLFHDNCGACHEKSLVKFPVDIDGFPTIANNGLDLNYQDKGRGSFTNWKKDNGKFKIPGLKNIALSGPYMHDGRFETLSDVVDHYSDNIQNHENLHEALKDQNGNAKKLNFSQDDKANLLAFLNTLTDENMALASKWSDPFKK